MSQETKILEGFRERLDNNNGLVSKRKLLNTLAMIMLAIQFTGAVLKEANTFIFKIEFTNQHGLSVFLSSAVIFLMIRYYSYAREYHEELFNLWASRMLDDYKVFNYDPHSEEVSGLLGNAVDVWGGDVPGIQNAKYKIDGIFGRKLVYWREFSHEEDTDLFEETVPLNKFTDKWKFWHLLIMYVREAQYQIAALVTHRENLDLLGPYLLGFFALLLTFLKIDISSVLQIWSAIST